MKTIKDLYESFITEKADNIDPYNLITENGPWLTGSYVLQKYTNDNWKPNDIDYVVKNKFQYDFVFRYFKKICDLHEVTPQKTDNFFVGKKLIQILPAKYKDIRLRLDRHDISVCQIGHNGNEYILSKKCKQHIENKQFSIDSIYGISTSKYQTEQRIKKYISRGYNKIS